LYAMNATHTIPSRTIRKWRKKRRATSRVVPCIYTNYTQHARRKLTQYDRRKRRRRRRREEEGERKRRGEERRGEERRGEERRGEKRRGEERSVIVVPCVA
jgi:hypothetical protein